MKNLRPSLAVFLLSLLAAPALADHATFELVGVVNEVYFNPFGGKTEAIVEPGNAQQNYIVRCDTPSCDAQLHAALGDCTYFAGNLQALFINPPYTFERFLISTLQASSGCPAGLSTFSILGRLTTFFPASQTNSGQPEFNVSVNGATFRHVCDPTYGACAFNASRNVGQCVVTSGEGESFVLGFSGEQSVVNWTLFVARVFGCA